MLLPVLLWLVAFVCASNTLYSFGDGAIYVHLDNNDLVKLNFSITGLNQKFIIPDFNYEDGQSISTLHPPPDSSTLFLVGSKLFAMAGDGSTDGCGHGDLKLHAYSENSDSWSEVSCDTSEINDSSYMYQSSFLTSPLSKEVYIYGGKCQDGTTTSRLISFNTTTCQFKNITTSTKPHSFYGAANILAPDPQTQLLIGGESELGWLNMNQLATWNFQSGWSFRSVSPGNVTVDSRVGALALPVFKPLTNSSIETIANSYAVSQVIVIGGTTDGRASSPEIVSLNTNINDWNYSQMNSSNVDTQALGFAAIFNNLVAITNNAKRDDSYTLRLYNIGDDFKTVSEIKNNIQKPEQEAAKSSKNIQTKAILGTVLPVAAILAAVAAGFLVMKKRKKQRMEKELDDMNHQYENYFDRLEKEKHTKTSNELTHNLLYNESNSTIDLASIDSWVRKRQDFDSQKKVRNSYMASQETLNDETTSLAPYPSTPSPTKMDKLNRSMLKLRSSLSFSNLPTPDRKTTSQLMTDEVDYEAEIENERPENPFQEPEIHTELDDMSDSDSSFDDNRDVQVLVSSKRRSTLRVVNPDLENIDEESMRSLATDSHMRQRVPSNEDPNES